MPSQFSVLASHRRKLSFERKDFPAMNKLFKNLLCLVLFVAALGAQNVAALGAPDKDKDKKLLPRVDCLRSSIAS